MLPLSSPPLIPQFKIMGEQISPNTPLITPTTRESQDDDATSAPEEQPTQSQETKEVDGDAKSAPEEPKDGESCTHEEDDDDDFEFAVGFQDLAAADEIFANGQIRPLYYPLFNQELLFSGEPEPPAPARAAGGGVRGQLRQLLMDERRPAAADELAGIPPDSYCVWVPRVGAAPAPAHKKSGSTGSSSLRWRLRGLAVGRSHSDGKDKFVFLDSKNKGSSEKGKKDEAAVGRNLKSGGRRRSFLPYREKVVGVSGPTDGFSF